MMMMMMMIRHEVIEFECIWLGFVSCIFLVSCTMYHVDYHVIIMS